MNNDPRKATDILLSIEEQIGTLVKTMSSYDLNIKLILNHLNTSKGQLVVPLATPAPPKIMSNDEFIEVSSEPIRTQRQQRTAEITTEQKEIKKQTIPVGQKVLDANGKEAFMADVSITDLSNGEVKKLRTNVVGKWQSQLSFGKYSIKISKLLDTEPPTKAESTQEIEIRDGMKSLIIPTISIKK